MSCASGVTLPASFRTMLPVVQVATTRLGTSFSQLGLVDSGADWTGIPSWIVEDRLGLTMDDLSEVGSIRTVGGVVQGWHIDIDLSVLGHTFATSARVFRATPEVQNFMLLGRKDFFAEFRIAFDWTSTSPSFTLTSARAISEAWYNRPDGVPPPMND